MSHAANLIAAYCRGKGYPEPVPEYRFAPGRRFAFDLCWVREKVSLEVEGGIFGKGRPCPMCKRRPPAGHTSVERLKTDMEKYNLASILGFRVVRCRPEEIDSGAVFSLIDKLFDGSGVQHGG